ncbi:MAG: hypothetical protein D6790_20480 [Caldilineae bacterium]|nr:MAG: hypothetical protein D6790_20480 [Caldilineae bacterium]
MRGGGRIVGLAIMIIAVVLFLGWTAVVVTATGNTPGGMVLGIFLALVVCAPLLGIGFYMFRRGQQEEVEFAQVAKEKTILNMVLTQGQVTVGEIVAELQEPREAVEDMIRNLVGKQLFSGAINWEKGVLYSVESQQLTEGKKCPNCGGELEFAGKGLIVCPWCGSEVFLTKRAAAETK